MAATLVFVHGAYADASSWNGVLSELAGTGSRMVAVANPLRGLASDTAALNDLLVSIDGPIVLVGHSYGGAVMTGISGGAVDIAALVYVAGFALDAAESCAAASALTPGSTLADTLEQVPLAGGDTDTYIAQQKYHHQFCADLSDEQAALMAITQRPVTGEALAEPAADTPLWRSKASWFIFGELDHNIPAGAHRIMAQRAGARRSIEIPGASHVVGISHSKDVAELIQEALTSTSTDTH
jgi:pimeloyl-ACP methyl ester carboxylesterase